MGKIESKLAAKIRDKPAATRAVVVTLKSADSAAFLAKVRAASPGAVASEIPYQPAMLRVQAAGADLERLAQEAEVDSVEEDFEAGILSR